MAEYVLTQQQYAQFLHHIRGHNGQLPGRPPVKSEHTFERDLTLCTLHRQWGYDVPATDIDFLEYDNRNPNALVEYKKRDNWRTAPVDKDANLTALIRLGNRAQIPVFCVFYKPDHSMFRVIPVNTFGTDRQQGLKMFGDDGFSGGASK